MKTKQKTIGMNSKTTTEIAQQYLSKGFSPIPIVPGEKRPTISGWTKYGADTIGFKEAEKLFANTDSIGLVCGYDNMEVLDIDLKYHKGDEMDRFEKMLDDNSPGLREKMVVQTTRSGGKHWIYKCSAIEKNQKLANNLNGDATFETRGTGGQIVAYPSPGYSFDTTHAVQFITPEERNILLTCARDLDAAPKHVVGVADYNGKQQEKQHTPWGDYRAEHNALEELLKHGWTAVRENEEYIYMKRPGDTSAKDSGRIFKDSGLFWPWTTSTEFKAERPYDAFQIYMLIEHNDDLSSASNALSALGYGKQYLVTLANDELFIDDIDEEEKSELQARLEEMEVDSTQEVKQPPIAVNVVDATSKYIFGTRGNFSLVQGKAKSRKSYFVSSIAAASLSDHMVAGKLEGLLGDKVVVYIDTEQGEWHAHKTKRRILRMAGLGTDDNNERLRYFQFRGLERNSERMKLVEFAIQTIENIGVIILDGIVDLSSKGVNDEEEATEIASRLLKWTANHDCHAICVLHENKNDTNAKGHLGAYLTQKAETVVSVRKHEDLKDSSVIMAEYTRNIEFPDMQMDIFDDDVMLNDYQEAAFYKDDFEWSSQDIEELSREVHLKSRLVALEHIKHSRDVKPKEASKALVVMEKGGYITWQKGKIYRTVPKR